MDVTFASTQSCDFRAPVSPMPDDLKALGVVELQATGTAKSREAVVRVDPMPVDVSSGVDDATEAVEERLAQGDNTSKLAGEWPRRELFVWIDSPSRARSALSTYSPMPERVAAARPPRLPDEVTSVWAALFPLGEQYLAMSLWLGDRSGWTVIDPPQRR